MLESCISIQFVSHQNNSLEWHKLTAACVYYCLYYLLTKLRTFLHVIDWVVALPKNQIHFTFTAYAQLNHSI